MISETQFLRMMPNAGARLAPHWPYIVPAMERGRITTSDRIAAFLAHVAHESGEYRDMEEIASGDAYDQRTDLGNTPEIDGDGAFYKAHGPIGITGKDNHRACGQYLGVDAVNNPRVLMVPQYATASAVWFWTIGNKKIDLNILADLGWFKTMTRVINGGLNGLSDRRQYWDRNRAMLGLPYVDLDREGDRVREFQRAHGLTVDGDVGDETLGKLARLYR